MAIAPSELQHGKPLVGIGTMVLLGVGCVALSDTAVGPLIVAALAAAAIYNATILVAQLPKKN